MDDNAEQIESAIAALEAQRALLGDAVVGMAVAPLQEKLAALRERSRGEPQLKTVTVLFMDIVGSTRLSQHLDPEDVHAVMDSALQRLTTIVVEKQGKVLQYAGDSLLAVFGAERALEDDVDRAVRAGLAIVEEAPRLAERFNAEHGLDGFGVRVGVHTGPVLLGGGIDAEGSIRGITVNIAARMEQAAPPGSLRISHDTYRQVRGMFEIAAQPPIEIKGITGPVRSYLVIREKQRAFRMANRGLEGIESAMVGRDAELARITDAYEAACEDEELGVITVVGEPGIGKSRLGIEFAQWLELLPDNVRFYHCRPQPYGNHVPYGLVRDMLARRFDILDSDSQAAAKAKLAEGIGEVLKERTAEYTALIGKLIGLDFDDDPHIAAIASEAKQLRDRAFHALSRYFLTTSKSSGEPIVVVLDDLHWADDGSLDFANHLAQACRDIPMLMLCLTRSTLYERRPLWGSGQSRHQRIDLSPLTKRGTRDLIDGLLSRLQAVPDALRDLLAGSAEGNPYFVEELIGMLIDDGVIVTEEEPWRVVAEKLLDVNVPGTLAGVIQARIDGLPPPEKLALQQASVVGHVFWDEALQRIAPTATETLEGLTRRELAYGRETSAFEGTREFVFKHHVLHQVVYHSVLKGPRRAQHRSTADWLVVRSGDRASEYFGLIADHYERAGDVANAVEYLRRAGEDAAHSYVNEAALDFLGRALALVPESDAAMRFTLIAIRRTVYAATGRRAEQAEDVAILEQLAETLADDARRARAAGVRASLALVTGDYPSATVAAQRAVALAEAAGEQGAALTPLLNWARALQFQGDYVGAHSRADQLLALSRQLGDRRVESTTLMQLGIIATQRGHHHEARDFYRQALAVARANGDRSVESGAINNLGETERQLGNYEAAFELLESGRRLCAEIGQRMAESYLMCNMAQIAFQRGDAADAVRLVEETTEIAERLKDRDLHAILLCIRANALTALGDWDAADAAYRESVTIFREIGRPTMPPEPIAGLARLALARGNLIAAREAITEVVAHFDAGGSVDGTEDPLWIHLTCHDVLVAAGEARAVEFLRLAYEQLMARAALLGDAERASFLANVPSHRDIVAAWAKLEAVPPAG